MSGTGIHTRVISVDDLTPHDRFRVFSGTLPDHVYIGRLARATGTGGVGVAGEWGNPFSHMHSRVLGVVKVATRKEAIRRFERYVRSRPELVARIRRELRGKVLVCWCKPQPCHGDVLARIADEEVQHAGCNPQVRP